MKIDTEGEACLMRTVVTRGIPREKPQKLSVETLRKRRNTRFSE